MADMQAALWPGDQSLVFGAMNTSQHAISGGW